MHSGPEQLMDWMRRRAFNQKETGDFLGFGETYISQLVNRKRSPNLANAILIERKTGIPVEAWSSQLDQTVSATTASAQKQSA